MTTYSIPLTYSRAIELSLTLDGVAYQAVIGFNVFGQRSYITLTDQYGNRLFTLPLIGSANPDAHTYTVADPQNVETPAKTVTYSTVKPVNIVAGYFKRSTLYYFPADQTLVVTP